MKKVVVLSLFVFLSLLSSPTVFCSDYIVRHSSEIYISVLRIDHFNDDSVKDTLFGLAEKDYKFKPRYIKWGKDTMSLMPLEKLVDYTEISYPSHTWSNTSCTWTDPSRTWSDFHVAANIDRLNGDDLADMILIMWGKVTDGLDLKDTAIAITIFGQRGLDTLAVLYTADIDTLQSTPFYAKSFRHGAELTSGKFRDLSRVPSYKVNKIVVDGLDEQGPGNIGNPIDVSESVKPFVRIYPNPASEYTNLEISDLSPGNYNVNILSLQGNIISTQNIQVTVSKEFINNLKLNDLATGYYILQLFNNKLIVGNYQLIIVH